VVLGVVKDSSDVGDVPSVGGGDVFAMIDGVELLEAGSPSWPVWVSSELFAYTMSSTSPGGSWLASRVYSSVR
jgi:hypothetical protein